jgi:hypothetical protein
MNGETLRADAARFLAASGPVGILPPDQYLALVVRVTEGCSWNACTFCGLYRDVPFRWKRPDELRAHLAALREYFGPSIALRRSIFLGDANALCLPHHRLLPSSMRSPRPPRDAPLSFVDAWTGQRKSAAEWRDYAVFGLRWVYVGLETGDPGFMAWFEKFGSPQDAVDRSGAARGRHRRRRDRASRRRGLALRRGSRGADRGSPDAMRLGPDDLLYFSEYVDEPGSRTAAARPPPRPAAALARNAELRQSILADLRLADPTRPPQSATYDIQEFVY